MGSLPFYSHIESCATQQLRDIHPMLFDFWSTVCDAGPTVKQHRVSASRSSNMLRLPDSTLEFKLFMLVALLLEAILVENF